jgi:hypothetical protein
MLLDLVGRLVKRGRIERVSYFLAAFTRQSVRLLNGRRIGFCDEGPRCVRGDAGEWMKVVISLGGDRSRDSQ